MNPEQKTAWFIIVTFCLSVVAFLLLLPVVGLQAAWAALGLMGICGLSPVIFRKKRKEGEVDYDERDRAILQKATTAGGMSSYLVFVLVCMIPWFVYRWQGQEEISIEYLPFAVICGCITLFVARAVTILVLYRRGAPADAG